MLVKEGCALFILLNSCITNAKRHKYWNFRKKRKAPLPIFCVIPCCRSFYLLDKKIYFVVLSIARTGRGPCFLHYRTIPHSLICKLNFPCISKLPPIGLAVYKGTNPHKLIIPPSPQKIVIWNSALYLSMKGIFILCSRLPVGECR